MNQEIQNEYPQEVKNNKALLHSKKKKNVLAFPLKSSQHCIQQKQTQCFEEQTKYLHCAHLLLSLILPTSDTGNFIICCKKALFVW